MKDLLTNTANRARWPLFICWWSKQIKYLSLQFARKIKAHSIPTDL